MEGRKQDEIKYTTNGNIAALDGAGTCLAGWIGVVASLYVSPESLTLSRITDPYHCFAQNFHPKHAVLYSLSKFNKHFQSFTTSTGFEKCFVLRKLLVFSVSI